MYICIFITAPVVPESGCSVGMPSSDIVTN